MEGEEGGRNCGGNKGGKLREGEGRESWRPLHPSVSVRALDFCTRVCHSAHVPERTFLSVPRCLLRVEVHGRKLFVDAATQTMKKKNHRQRWTRPVNNNRFFLLGES